MISSERFILRALKPSDASTKYLSWLSDDVSRFILNKQESITELQNYISENNAQENTYLFGIFTKQTDTHIGNIKFIIAPYEQGNCAEMGILIGEKQWHGKGVAKEVIFAFIDAKKEEYKLKRVLLGVDKANSAAVHAYLKMGFKTLEPGQLDNPELTGVDMELMLN